jgi:hypothetical protein
MTTEEQIRFIAEEATCARISAHLPEPGEDPYVAEERAENLTEVAETLKHFLTLQQAFKPLVKPMFESVEVKVSARP